VETFFAAQAKFPEPPPPRLPPTPPAEPESFEMRPRHVLVCAHRDRDGVTALAFWVTTPTSITRSGRGHGKIALMYGASFGLLAAGQSFAAQTCEFKELRQVLFLRAVWRQSISRPTRAHHLRMCALFPARSWTGSLLLGWTAFIVWLAIETNPNCWPCSPLDWRITPVITDVGSFTLISNLLLQRPRSFSWCAIAG